MTYFRTGSSLLAIGLVLALGCQGNPGNDAGEISTTSAKPATVKVTMLPDTEASGETHGQPFKVIRADMQNNILTLHGDEGRTFFVFLFLDEDESAVGRRFTFKSAELGDPHIHMHYRSSDGIEIETFMEKYSLELEFGQPAAGKLPGRIHLRVPDETGSFVAGRFEADLPG